MAHTNTPRSNKGKNLNIKGNVFYLPNIAYVRYAFPRKAWGQAQWISC
jgi:hypothetical protein